MPKLAGFSGNKVVSILQKSFGFLFVSQKGSHIKLRKVYDDMVITVIVPKHAELSQGTLRGILTQAKIDLKIFLKNK